MNRNLLFSTLIVPLACVVGCHAASPLQFFRGPTSDAPSNASVESLAANAPDHLKSSAGETLSPQAATAEPSELASPPAGTPALPPQLLISDLLPLPTDAQSPGEAPLAAPAADALAIDASNDTAPTSNAPAAPAEPSAISRASAVADSDPGSKSHDVPLSQGGEAAAASGLTAIAQKTLGALRLNLYPSSPGEPSTLSGEIAQFERFPFAFDLATVAGERVSSANFGGQLMIIDVWATWCGPCRRAIPDFIQIQKEYEAKGVQVIGITCDSDDPADAADTARKAYNIGEEMSINYPLLVDDGTTTKQIPGFRGYPTTLFMTPDGVVRYKVTGVQSKAKLAAMIEAILQE